MSSTTGQREILAAALQLVAEQGWRSFSPAALAETAVCTKCQAVALFPHRAALLPVLTRQVDRTALANPPTQGTPKDKLFDLLMRRFDVLLPFRENLRVLLPQVYRDPISAAVAWTALHFSMHATLQIADIPVRQPLGFVRVEALTIVYVRTLQNWLKDRSDDFSSVMAVLDRRLRYCEHLAERLGTRRTHSERREP